MDLETYNDIYNREKQFLRAGTVKGRNILLKDGFTACGNPQFLQKGKLYAHYNRIMRVWLIDEPTEDKSGILIFT